MSKKYTFLLWSLLFHSWNQLLVWMIAIKNLSLIFWMHSIFLLFHPKYVSQMSWRNIELPLRRKNGINIWICYWKCYFKWWVIVCGVTWLLIFFPGNSPFPPSICFLVEKRTDECQRGNQSAWVWDTTTRQEEWQCQSGPKVCLAQWCLWQWWQAGTFAWVGTGQISVILPTLSLLGPFHASRSLLCLQCCSSLSKSTACNLKDVNQGWIQEQWSDFALFSLPFLIVPDIFTLLLWNHLS